MKNVLITGVSTGIGYGAAKEFVKRGTRVFGSVRRHEDAMRLKEEWGQSFFPVVFDVTDQDAVDQAVIQVTDELKDRNLDCLINNSGIAIGGPIQYQEMEEIERHFQVNVMGLIRVTKAFLPLLGAKSDRIHPPGRIINISSVAGKLAQPFVGAYVSSKHAVEGFSHSLRRELLLYDIDVVIIGPGAVKTPIWDKGIKMEKYEHTPYFKILSRFAKMAKKGGESGLTIEYFGERIANIAEKKKPKIRYSFVPNTLTNWIIPMILPARMIDRFIKKQLFEGVKTRSS